MSKHYENTDLSQDAASLQDEHLAFECRQAMIRKQFKQPSVEAEWKKFREKTHPEAGQANPVPQKRNTKTRYFVFGTLAGIAATLLIMLGFRWYDYYLEQRPVTVFTAEARNQEVVMNIDNNKQTVVSGNSDKDPIPGARVDSRKADFTAISAHKSQTRTIKTPYGKDYRVVLNDGTEVIMNADSKLTFPTRFSGKERIVSLEGEAYFKVAKNPDMPFVVKTDKMNTTALGTEFNVKAYHGAVPHVTLVEGVVLVDVPEVKKNVRLAPSEEISLNDKTVNIRNIDPQYYIQWKDGFFYYDNVALGEILSDIGRWYNINIEIEKPALMSYRLHFVVNRDAVIDDVINSLNDFTYLDAIKSGNKITVRGKN